MKTLKSMCRGLSLLLIIPLLFQSCEWDNNDDNYIEIERPEQVNIELDIAGVTDPETILYVYNNTKINYTLSETAQEFIGYRFYLDGQEMYMSPSSTEIDFYMYNVDDKIHDLKLFFYLKSGTGSIADLVGLEMYGGEFNFKVKILEWNTDAFNIKQSLHENKYLKLEWDKLEEPIREYRIYKMGWRYDDQELLGVTSENVTSFVIPSYFYGHQQYKVVAVAKYGDLERESNVYTVEYKTLEEKDFQLERLNTSDFKISLNNPNPYPASLAVQDKDGNYVQSKANENFLIVKGNSFPNYNTFSTYIIPPGYTGDDYDSFRSFYLYPSDNVIEGPPSNISIDYLNSQVVGINYGRFFVYNKDIQLIKTADVGYETSSGSRVNVSASGLVVVQPKYYDNSLIIFSDQTLEKELATINNVGFNENLLSVGKDKLVLLDTYLDGYPMKVYNARTGELLLEQKTSKSRHAHCQISYDDKYIFARNYDEEKGSSDATLYELKDDNTLSEKFSIANNVKYAYFNYLNPDELIVGYSNKFDVLDINTQQVKKNITGTYHNIDPVTGNMLYSVSGLSYDKRLYTILDNKLDNKIGEFYIDFYIHDGIFLFNGYFIFRNSYFIQADKLITK